MGQSSESAATASQNRFVVNDENLFTLYMQVLDLSGLPQESRQTLSVKVGEHDGQRIDMFTLIIDPASLHTKPVLVFLHGYAASAVLYYNMYKRLSEKFCIIAVDHVGMGASSRPDNFNWEEMAPRQCMDYFVNYLELWRQKFSQNVYGRDLTDFYLMGHSFGGCVAGNYTSQHPDKVKRLIMMSPIGISGYDEQQLRQASSDDASQKDNPCASDFPLTIRLGLNLVWKQKISPYDVARVFGERFLRMIIEEYLESRVADEYERDIAGAYTFQIFMKKSQQEMVLLVLFDNQVQSYIPLDRKLVNSPTPISIVMGDDDWVLKSDNEASPKMIAQQKKEHGVDSSFYVLPNSGHNCNLDNLDGLIDFVLGECFGREASERRNYQYDAQSTQTVA